MSQVQFTAKLPEGERAHGLWQRLKRQLERWLDPFVNRLMLVSAHFSESKRKVRDRRREAFLAEQSDAERVCLETPDGVQLDALVIRHSDPDIRAQNRWIVYFPGNSEQYEDHFRYALRYREQAGANVLFFNYRGVGRSEGKPSARGLDLDALTVLQYAVQGLGAEPSKTVVIGRSLGGGVALKAVQRYPEMGYCNDRSFSNLLEVCRSYVGMGPIGYVSAHVVRIAGWDIDSVENWLKLKHHRKWIIYHREDFTVPYDIAQLHFHVKDEEGHLKRLEDIEITSLWALGRDAKGSPMV